MATQQFFTVKDVPAQDFIKAYADYLKKNNKIKIAEWTNIVKTGPGRQLPPIDPDWVYIRAAAIARKIYVRGHWGVGNLEHMFGGRTKNGNRREKHEKGSGKVIRWLMQQLESIKVLQKDKYSTLKKNSRIITKEGQQDLNRIATQVALAARNRN